MNTATRCLFVVLSLWAAVLPGCRDLKPDGGGKTEPVVPDGDASADYQAGFDCGRQFFQDYAANVDKAGAAFSAELADKARPEAAQVYRDSLAIANGWAKLSEAARKEATKAVNAKGAEVMNREGADVPAFWRGFGKGSAAALAH